MKQRGTDLIERGENEKGAFILLDVLISYCLRLHVIGKYLLESSNHVQHKERWCAWDGTLHSSPSDRDFAFSNTKGFAALRVILGIYIKQQFQAGLSKKASLITSQPNLLDFERKLLLKKTEIELKSLWNMLSNLTSKDKFFWKPGRPSGLTGYWQSQGFFIQRTAKDVVESMVKYGIKRGGSYHTVEVEFLTKAAFACVRLFSLLFFFCSSEAQPEICLFSCCRLDCLNRRRFQNAPKVRLESNNLKRTWSYICFIGKYL